jgi:aryl-alcohol dehydrogenase-like predicted oxidoreductase
MPYQDMKAIVAEAIAQGINFFDCAEAYGNGSAEKALGRILKDLGAPRSSVIIAEKFGKHRGESNHPYTAADIREAVNASLTNLQMNYIDLYQVHWAANVADFPETVSTLKALQAEGKIKFYG